MKILFPGALSMNACYRWLPGGPTLHSYGEEHARGKIQQIYPDAVFERQDDPALPEHHVTRAWADAVSRQNKSEPVAEIWWTD